MKTLLLFVAASLILVGAMVVIATPNTVEAKGSYCTHNIGCFDSKKECKDASQGISGDICNKQKAK